jgi:hypothetical protein
VAETNALFILLGAIVTVEDQGYYTGMFARHPPVLRMPCHEGEESSFKMDVLENFKRSVQNKIAEGVTIHCSMDTFFMKGRNKWIQQATLRFRVTEEFTVRTNRGRRRLPG